MAFDLRFDEDQEALVAMARDFARREILPVAAAHDKAGSFPRALVDGAFKAGLLHPEIPEAQGGAGLSCLTHCLLTEEIAYACPGVNTIFAASMLGAMPLLVAGTEEQRRRWLPRLTSAARLAAFCCSEPDAGSDVAAVRTRYRRDGDGFVLSGQKRWISNGGVADFYTVLATVDPAKRHKGMAVFIVAADAPGVSAGREEDKVGHRASNTTDVLFEEVRVPAAALVGAEGAGFGLAMRTFDRSRPWIAAAAAGLIRRCLDESTAYARERKTFGVPIGEHQAIGFLLAEMAIAYESTRLLCHKAAWQIDQGQPDSVVSSYAKAHGADAAMRVATDAVQILGGYGYTREYPVEKLFRDAKLLQIYEGTSQIQRVVIARHILQAKR